MLETAQPTVVSPVKQRTGTDQRRPPEVQLTENALAVLKRRYLRKGPDGQPAETVEQMFHRVASHVAAVEAQWGGNVAEAEAIFYDLVASLRFMPNSPTFTGAGTPLGQLAACFVLPISDDMGREPDGIFQTLRNMALIQQTGGGTGFSFSRLRPKGAIVRSSGGQATGPVGFMRVFDTACEIVSQGGARRGANMAVLRVDHPDIHEFIQCKRSEHTITNFNISVGVTDAFMRAVEADGVIDLVNPQDGKVWKTVRAREIFDEIVAGAHRNGEPGVLFLDTANRQNPCPHLGEYEATNPCVLGSTWVVTDNGPAQVEQILGKPVRLLVNGRYHPTSAEGFFFTGQREVMEVRTRQGFNITVTPNHPLRLVTRMTRHVLESEWRRAGDIRIGDRVLLGEHRDASWAGRGTWEEGFLLGLLVGDGTITTGRAIISIWGEGSGPESVRREVERIVRALPHRADFQGFTWIADRQESRLTLKALHDLACSFGLSEQFKGISPEIEQTSSAFHEGFLRGLFDADGTVVGDQKKGVSVRLAQSNLALLEAVQRMLHRLGIVATLYEGRRAAGHSTLPDGKGGSRKYVTQAQHELVISGDNLKYFAARIGFTDQEKASRLRERLDGYRRRLNRERFVDEVVSIEPRGKAPVYDVRVPGAHAFDANGFYVHNCGEQYLLPYENCCLGSVNLARHVRYGDNGHPAVDWERLRETVEQATRFLDDVIDANAYVPAVPQLREAAQRTRRIGLGIMGLGDLMYCLGVHYGSDEAQELAAQVMEFIRYHAMRTSIELARERGPFPAIQGSIYDPENLRWTPPRPLTPYTRLRKWGRPPLDWDAIIEGIRRHGIRNAAQTTVAPTGTIATVSNCEAYGCEPVFALAYVRHVNDNGRDLELRYTSPLFLQALEQAGLDQETQERIIQQVVRTGSCQAVEEVPPHIREVFVVASDIPAEEHVRMQAALQAFVDASISKCVAGDTLLLTGKGLLPIGDLYRGESPDAFRTLNDPLPVADWGASVMATEFYYGGEQDTIRLTTDLGIRLEATPNHRVRVMGQEGIILWRRMDELREGDYLVVPYDYPEALGRQYEFSRIYGTPYQPAKRTAAKSFSWPYKITRDLARLLGYLTADGYLGENWVQLVQSDDRVADDAEAILRSHFGADVRRSMDKRREHLHVVQVNGRDLVRFFRDYLGMGGLSPTRHIPRCVTAAGPLIVREYLRGLTLDGYVSPQGHVVPLTTMSEQLAREAQALFLVVGVPTRLSRKKVDYTYQDGRKGSISYVLTVLPEFRERFLETIGFAEEHKNETAHRLLPPPRQQRGGQIPGIQDLCIALIQAKLPRVRSRRAEDYLRSTLSDLRQADCESLAVDRVRHLLDLCADLAEMAEYRQLAEIVERKVICTRVTGLASGRAPVYDLHVPETHAFISNGLVSHNTINFPSTATPDDVARAFRLAWELGCKGLTVYVTGSREKEVLETEATRQAKQQPQPAPLPLSTTVRPRPHRLEGATYHLSTPLGTAYLTINSNGDGEPFEVFLNVGKAGSDTAAVAEAIGRLISLILRIPSPLSATRRLKQVVKQLKGIGGGRPLGFGRDRVRSLPDGVAQGLAEHLGMIEPPEEKREERVEQLALFPAGDLCPECGHAAVVNEEGCRRCYACGYSEC